MRPGSRQIADLTCCRALLAVWVFSYHVGLHLGVGMHLGPAGGMLGAPAARGYLGALAARGYLGVDGFFALSGMVLAVAHPPAALPDGALAAFWLRRLLRIYPLHLAMIAALAACWALAGLAGVGLHDAGRLAWGELGRHLLLLHGWGASVRWAWNYPSWSISAEWAGYLAFPFLWRWLGRWPPAAAAALALLLVGALAAVDRAQGRVGLNLTYEGALWRFFPEFTLGMLTVVLAPALAAAVRGRALAAGAAAACLAALLAGAPDWAVAALLWLALAGLYLAARQGRGGLLSPLPGLAWCGRLSYAFYMSFALVETLQAAGWRALGLAPGAWPVAFAITAAAATLAVAVVAHRCIEQPAMRLWPARGGDPVAAAAAAAAEAEAAAVLPRHGLIAGRKSH